jgi:hypothetical protein
MFKVPDLVNVDLNVERLDMGKSKGEGELSSEFGMLNAEC